MSDEILSPQRALIYVMVVMAAADREMTDRELKRIGDQVRNLPVFADFDERDLVPSTEECAAQLGREGGLDRFLDIIVGSLPAGLVETAYALACEIAAADLRRSSRKRYGCCRSCVTGSVSTAWSPRPSNAPSRPGTPRSVAPTIRRPRHAVPIQ